MTIEMSEGRYVEPEEGVEEIWEEGMEEAQMETEGDKERDK